MDHRSLLVSAASTPPYSDSVTPASRSLTPVATGALDSDPAIARKRQTLALLGIDYDQLPDHNNNLQGSYQRYQLLRGAQVTYRDMVNAKTWSGPKLSQNGIVDLFISKTHYYSHWRIKFLQARDYPELLKWLEKTGPEGSPTNEDIWGEKKPPWSFVDMENYMIVQKARKEGKGKGKEREEKEVGKKGKDKKKGSGSGSKKKSSLSSKK